MLKTAIIINDELIEIDRIDQIKQSINTEIEDLDIDYLNDAEFTTLMKNGSMENCVKGCNIQKVTEYCESPTKVLLNFRQNIITLKNIVSSKIQ